MFPNNHPSIHFLYLIYPQLGCRGLLELIPAFRGEAGSSLSQGQQKKKQLFTPTLTPRVNQEWSFHPTGMFLDCGRKPGSAREKKPSLSIFPDLVETWYLQISLLCAVEWMNGKKDLTDSCPVITQEFASGKTSNLTVGASYSLVETNNQSNMKPWV